MRSFLNHIRLFVKKHPTISTVLAIALVIWTLIIAIVPGKLFVSPYSTLIYTQKGELLGARIADDGQWRFPMSDSLPGKYIKCVTSYEDKRFFYHFGVDPLAISRAIRQNIEAKGVVSGGSTLTMQLARLSRGDRDRNIYEKIVEMIWAVSIESTHRKKTILNLYASHAPFGGNVVGLETAAWRYYGRSPFDLSWAETATLAVLPNSPALIHPGRNRTQLLEKRNTLLAVLNRKGVLDDTEYELSCMEPLPDAPHPLPDLAPHLMDRISARTPGERVTTTLEHNLQRQVSRIVNQFARNYASNHINNLAAIVADIETGEIIAYVGNAAQPAGADNGGSVDIIVSPRSTGSILKPMLYAAMLDDGLILPSTLVSDTPLNINGFTPQNYNKTFYGAIPARMAIERSLNVPLVRMLSKYNTGRFLALLKSLGMTTLRFSEDHYGASLILGGAEGTLLDICGMYASMARMLNNHDRNDGMTGEYTHPLTPFPHDTYDPIIPLTGGSAIKQSQLSASAIWFAFEAMSGLNRPEEEADWQQFRSMKKIAWKTGTSYGGRDAWAVGVTPKYVVGVWAGNASGEGRPGLTGVGTAAPVLFDIFSLLPGSGWFTMPENQMRKMVICRESGHKASDICINTDTLFMPSKGVETELCPYHKLVHLSPDGRYRVNSSCESVDNMTTRSWFVLPPSQEYYFRTNHLEYQPLPPLKPGCGEQSGKQIDVIYPEHGSVLFLPRGFSGEQKFIFKAAHAKRDATIYWYMDKDFIGETTSDHQISCTAISGSHLLTLTDEDGNQRKIMFEVK